MLIGWAVFGQVVVFVIVIFVLKRILYSDTRSALNRLKQIDEENKQKEEELKKRKEQLEREYQHQLGQIEQEAVGLKEKASKEASRIKEEILEKALEQSKEIIKLAHTSKERMRQEIIRELEKEGIDFSCQLVKYVLSHKHLEQLQQGLIEEIIIQIEKIEPDSIFTCGERSRTTSLKEVEFVFNHPLSKEQKERLLEVLSKKVGQELILKEKKDETIVAGIIVRIGSLVIDGTLLAALREAGEALKHAHTSGD